MARGSKERTPAVRREENARYRDQRAAAGIGSITVMVPAHGFRTSRRSPWPGGARQKYCSSRTGRRRTRTDNHSVCGTLRIRLPVGAFETRGTAAEWLAAIEPRLGAIRPPMPKVRSRE